jgi:hypothetical protein
MFASTQGIGKACFVARETLDRETLECENLE